DASAGGADAAPAGGVFARDRGAGFGAPGGGPAAGAPGAGAPREALARGGRARGAGGGHRAGPAGGGRGGGGGGRGGPAGGGGGRRRGGRGGVRRWLLRAWAAGCWLACGGGLLGAGPARRGLGLR